MGETVKGLNKSISQKKQSYDTRTRNYVSAGSIINSLAAVFSSGLKPEVRTVLTGIASAIPP